MDSGGGEYGPPRRVRPRIHGVRGRLGRASGSWDRAFPPISAPARPPRPACPPSGITLPCQLMGGGRGLTAGGRGPAGGGGGARGEAGSARGPGGLGPLAGEAHAGGGHGGGDARAGDGGVWECLCENSVRGRAPPQRPLGPAGGAGFAAGRDRRVRDTPKDPPRPPRPPGPGLRRWGPAIPIIWIARLLNTSARQQNLSSPRLGCPLSVEPRGGDCIRRRDGMGNR